MKGKVEYSRYLHIEKRKVINIALAVCLLGLAIIPPIVHRVDMGGIAQAAFTKQMPDYTDGVKPSNKEGKPNDIIAVLGAGDSGRPNSFEDGRLAAAAILYLEGHAPKITLLDGNLGKGVKKNTDVEKLKQLIWELSNHQVQIPDKDIIIRFEKSPNTEESARVMNEIVHTYGLNRVMLVTHNFHMLRALSELHQYDIHVSGYSVEDVMNRYNAEWGIEVEKLNQSSDMVSKRNKEILGMVDLFYTGGEGSIYLKNAVADWKNLEKKLKKDQELISSNRRVINQYKNYPSGQIRIRR